MRPLISNNDWRSLNLLRRHTRGLLTLLRRFRLLLQKHAQEEESSEAQRRSGLWAKALLALESVKSVVLKSFQPGSGQRVLDRLPDMVVRLLPDPSQTTSRTPSPQQDADQVQDGHPGVTAPHVGVAPGGEVPGTDRPPDLAVAEIGDVVIPPPPDPSQMTPLPLSPQQDVDQVQDGHPGVSAPQDDVAPGSEVLVTHRRPDPSVAGLSDVAHSVAHYPSGRRDKPHKRREPGERGGRPRGPKGDAGPAPDKPAHTKPQLRCIMDGYQWHIVAEVAAADEQVAASVELRQAGDTLAPFGEEDESLWYALNLNDPIVASFVGSNEEPSYLDPLAMPEPPIIFRLVGEGYRSGHLVTHIANGVYLLVMPRGWGVQEGEDAIVADAELRLSTYQGYIIDASLLASSGLAFVTATGRKTIKRRAARFSLEGTRIADADQRMGPLFGGSRPVVVARSDSDWADVGTLVLGAEGRGRGRWRFAWTPAPEGLQQQLPEEMLLAKRRWYFLRIYDRQGNLTESLDFRYMPELSEICVSSGSWIGENGHSSATVTFRYAAGCLVQPTVPDPRIHVEADETETAVVIPADPELDRTEWLVHTPAGPTVTVSIEVPRLWWAVTNEDKTPRDWVDHPVGIRLPAFRAAAKDHLHLRMPSGIKESVLQIGFNGRLVRQVPLPVRNETVTVPLRNLQGVEETADPTASLSLDVGFGKNRRVTVAQVIVEFPCTICRRMMGSRQEVIDHALSEHLDSMFPHLTYDELRRSDSTLPAVIYLCPYCNKHFVKAGDKESATSEMDRHQAVCKQAYLTEGRIQLRFTVIDDVNRIRQNVIRSLPSIYRCRVCGLTLEGASPSQRRAHIRDQHSEKLVGSPR